MKITLSLFFSLCAVLAWADEKKADSQPGGSIEGVVKVTAPSRPQPKPASSSNGMSAYDVDNGYGSSPYDYPPPASAAPTLPEEIVVYLDKVKGHWDPPKEHAKLDQKFTQFTHRVLPVLAGTVVDFTNHDPIYHNCFSNSRANPFDLGRRHKGETATAKMLKPEVPVRVYCEIHSKMKSNILVMQNPFFTVVKPGGNFHLQGIPPGTYQLMAWHDYWEPVSKPVTVRASETAKTDLVLDKTQQ